MDTTEQRVVEAPRPIRWSAAVLAGLIIGAWFLIFPRGVPWSSVTFFSATVLGRVMPPDVPFVAAAVLHLAIAACYALVIAVVVHRLRPELAILAGAVIGFGLYLLNLAVVYYLFHWAYGRESAVIVAHVLFGAFTAGAYRGLASRGTREVRETP